jgi:hypothetical protein
VTYNKFMGIPKDLVGQRFGRLTVVQLTEKIDRKNRVWLCLCDCGNYKEARSSPLGAGDIKSCGCLQRDHNEIFRKQLTTHGNSARGNKTPEYSSWCHMKSRCQDTKHERYADWGGRGITVCQRWQSFENFLADMGPRPKGTTLVRADKNGNYEPINCTWDTPKERQANTRATLRLSDQAYLDNQKKVRAVRLKEFTSIYTKTEVFKKSQRRCRMRIRRETIDSYGGHCSCCGETILEFLALDHINNDGADRRRKGEGGGSKLYARLRRAGYPQGDFQVLCHNCNMAKAMYGVCPHQETIAHLLGLDVKRNPVVRERVLVLGDLPKSIPEQERKSGARRKIKTEQVNEMLTLYHSGNIGIAGLARHFRVSETTIYNTLHRLMRANRAEAA